MVKIGFSMVLVGAAIATVVVIVLAYMFLVGDLSMTDQVPAVFSRALMVSVAVSMSGLLFLIASIFLYEVWTK